MGNAMCGHLLKHFGDLRVFSRTKSALENLVAAGAKYALPEEICAECDVIVTMLGYPQDVEQVYLNEATGLIRKAKKGALLIDHTTSSPSLAKRLAQEAAQREISILDAPVSGGDVGARSGTLVIMCGGSEEAYQRSLPFIKAYSKSVEHFGDAGMGQHAKMANQISVASSIAAVCETLLYANRVGLDSKKLIDLIKHGAAQSFSLERYGPRILERDFKPGFYVEHFVKDMEICLEECRRMNLSLPALTNAHQLYKLYVAQGGGRRGAHGLLECLEFINNIKKE